MGNGYSSENTTEKSIRITADNQLLISVGGREELLDFNALYEGYFPRCRFTKAAVCDQSFFLAGTDDSGTPFLFSSLSGKVWTERNIRARIPLPSPKDYGDILSILYDGGTRQLFLITENGILVTLPDCPKCVRARKVLDTKAAGGSIAGGNIQVYDAEGHSSEIPVDSAAEYRCALSFALQQLETAGLVIDLRDEEERSKSGSAVESLFPAGKYFPFPVERTEALFEKLPKSTPLFFLCEHGWKADEAARNGRGYGFTQAYSLGGTQDLFWD